jgi:hypothetical protein
MSRSEILWQIHGQQPDLVLEQPDIGGIFYRYELITFMSQKILPFRILKHSRPTVPIICQ